MIFETLSVGKALESPLVIFAERVPVFMVLRCFREVWLILREGLQGTEGKNYD